MKPFNYPYKRAFLLAREMRRFLSQTETTAYSETNPEADLDRVELVRQIDWAKFADVMEQLEYCYKNIGAKGGH